MMEHNDASPTQLFSRRDEGLLHRGGVALIRALHAADRLAGRGDLGRGGGRQGIPQYRTDGGSEVRRSPQLHLGTARLLRQRGERLERPMAHLYETGRMRRTHLRGHPNLLKRLLIHVSAFNLGLVLSQQFGVGRLTDE